ncbi:Uncharacterised protein [Klebsiella pneumoniae]|nr:Uncharacterised protein [Klebsiella pneumoniae]
MTSKLTREQLHERARENVKALKLASRQTAFESAREEILADLQLAELALAAMDSEPVAEVVSIYGDPEAFGEREIRPLIGIQKMPYGTKLYRHAQPVPVVPVVPEGLNHETTDLVLRFASALADKLYKAEQKYGRSTDWMKDDWYDDCLQSLLEHIKKGDPKDVAAYCAFMWHHGWKTKVAQPAQEEQKSISDRQAIFALESAGAVTPIGRAYKMELNAYRASMLAAPSQEVK